MSMVAVNRSVRVKADPRSVIDYIADVQNHPAFIGPLKSVSKPSGDPKRVGTSWQWTYNLAGVHLEGRAETADFEEGKRFAFRTSGVKSTFTYSVEPDGGGTRLTADVSYELPDSVLAKIADSAAVVRLNEIEADRAIENLRIILDS
jgi:carbon monoxide dehydrogenase subunit G